MKIGFIFPGQGSQSAGMCKDLYDEYEEVRNVFNKVNNITGLNIEKLMFESEESVLAETKNTQICILTMSLAILKLLDKENIKSDITCGLSLGEYTSLIYGNILSFEDGIKVVQKRGEYMQNLAPIGNWKMGAILGLSDEACEEACKKVSNGFVRAVNFNCPGQVVASGDEEGIMALEEVAKEMGCKKVRVLNTSGPFHTEKLLDASNELKKELEKISFNVDNVDKNKVIKNLDGKFYNANDDFVQILANHIISPVRFSTCLKTMIDEGVDTFVEIGPGKTLSGFVKRIESENEINILNINNVESLKNSIEFLKKEGK